MLPADWQVVAVPNLCAFKNIARQLVDGRKEDGRTVLLAYFDSMQGEFKISSVKQENQSKASSNWASTSSIRMFCILKS